MIEKYHFKQNDFKLQRYPFLKYGSLKIYNSSDELLLDELSGYKKSQILTYHDRYSFLNTILSSEHDVTAFISYKSQLKAKLLNSKHVGHIMEEMSNDKSFDIFIIKLPKSLSLLDYYLSDAVKRARDHSLIYINFMTRHYSDKMKNIASRYAGKIEQSNAQKKARFLKLEKLRETAIKKEKKAYRYSGIQIANHAGVFSEHTLDIASEFLLKTLDSFAGLKGHCLDLGSGSGILSIYLKKKNPELIISGIEDFHLAYLSSIESAKINQTEISFEWNDNLENQADMQYDYIISNPPFHFEFVNTIEISHTLFLEARKKLKAGGKLIIVYNNHLNYRTFLEKIFSCEVLGKNHRFTVLACQKTAE